MILPGGSGTDTWTYQYALPSDILSVIYPKDDPASVSRRLIGITDDKGNQVGYIVNPVGRMLVALTNQTFDNSQNLVNWYEADYQYDGYVNNNSNADTHGWLTKVANTYTFTNNNGRTTSPLVENDYTYLNTNTSLMDGVGNRQSKTVINADNSQRTETYQYDSLNRLTDVDYGQDSALGHETQHYTFDSMSNRHELDDTLNGTTTTTTTYSCDAANRLYQRIVGSNTIPYTFDPNGNTTADTTGNDPNSNIGKRTNTWDSQNRLTHCDWTKDASTVQHSDFVYAADGLRHQTTMWTNSGAQTVTNYALDGSMFVRELTGSLGAQATYLTGPRGPEYRRDDTSNGATAIHWYLYDGLGSVIGEMDSSGTILASRKFDVYGAQRNLPDTGSSSQKSPF